MNIFYPKKIAITILFTLLTFTISAEKIKIYTSELPPYHFFEENIITGIATEIVMATLQEAGLPHYPIITMPWARSFIIVKNEKNSMLFTAVRTPAREEDFLWVGPIIPEKDAQLKLWKLKRRTEIKISSIDDCKKYRIGVIRDAMPFTLKKHNFPPELITQTNTEDQRISMLLAQRIDLMPMTELSLCNGSHKMKKLT
ncbi:MAG: transporter substrate-binding domain-containing protein [Spirochaetales bacterium]|nr:transporter substrate-binding domain-containing protein [Spirochaetales bacterium]